MYLKVFVTPGAKRDKVDAMPSDKEGTRESLTVSVREPASGNRANLRVRELIAERLHVQLQKVRILTGHRSRSKMLSIDI